MRRMVLTSAAASPNARPGLARASNDSGFQEYDTPEFSPDAGRYESDADIIDDDMSLRKSNSAPMGLYAAQHNASDPMC